MNKDNCNRFNERIKSPTTEVYVDVRDIIKYYIITATVDEDVGACTSEGAVLIDLTNGPVKIVSPDYATKTEPLLKANSHCRWKVQTGPNMVSKTFPDLMERHLHLSNS